MGSVTWVLLHVILLEMCQNVVRRRIKRTTHKIKDQLNVSNRKSCHVYM